MLFLIIILAFDFLADHILQDHREKYFFAESKEIGQHQYQEQLIPPFFWLFWSKHTCFQGFFKLKLWASKHYKHVTPCKYFSACFLDV